MAGQAARLVRVLTPFAAVSGAKAIVAQDAAGHGALTAATLIGSTARELVLKNHHVAAKIVRA